MKHLFFALVACLLTACFRPPQPIPLPGGTPAHPAAVTATTPSPAPEAYASSDTVAAAAGSVPRGERVDVPQSPPARVAAHQAAHAPAPSPPQRTFGRREVKKMLRNALSGGYPETGKQDTPPAKRNSMALASLITGIGGLAAFVLGIVASAGTSGGVAGILFLLALIGGILATVFGGVAKGQIRNGQGTADDRGRATAGLILGIVNMSVFALLILLAIAFILAWGRG